MLLIFFAIFIGLAGPAFAPLKSVLSDANVLEDIRGAVKNFTIGGGFAPFADTVIAALLRGKTVISENWSSLTGPIVLVAVAIFVGKFLFTLAALPAADVLMQSMSTSAHTSLIPSYVSYIKKSLLYSLLYTVVALPLDFAILITAFLITKLYVYFKIIALTLAAAFAFAALACRSALFSMWIPSIVVEKMSVINAFKNNFKMLKMAFPSALSCGFIIIISIWCASVSFSVVTFGVAPLLLFPLGACFSLCVQMVLYYNLTGKKYYTDPITIIDSTEDLIDKK